MSSQGKTGASPDTITAGASPSKEEVTAILCAVLRGEAVDWPAAGAVEFYAVLLEQARLFGVDALVCYLLKPTAAWAGLPAQLQDGLVLGLRTGIAFEMVRARDLLVLLQALERAGIASLILKGGALAYTHYPEPSLRLRCDTDILIDSGDIRKIRAVFHALEYQLSGRIYKSHQFNFFRSTLGGVINYDVHWRPNNRAKYARVLSFAEVIGAALPVPNLEGALGLKPVHALLLACMHRAANPRHDPDRLIWLYDIHLLVGAMSESELLEFAQRAASENIQAICRDALDKAQECFATRVPGQVDEILSMPAPADSMQQRFADSQLALILDDIRQLPDWRSKLELIGEYLFPPGDYLLDRYGKQGRLWVPVLYLRYFFWGIFERISLR